MNPDVLAALISASAAVSTAVLALALNHPGFTIENRITSLDNRMTGLETTDQQPLHDYRKHIESDLKEFFKLLAQHD